MYVCIDLFAEVKAGEVVIVRSDERGGDRRVPYRRRAGRKTQRRSTGRLPRVLDDRKRALR